MEVGDKARLELQPRSEIGEITALGGGAMAGCQQGRRIDPCRLLGRPGQPRDAPRVLRRLELGRDQGLRLAIEIELPQAAVDEAPLLAADAPAGLGGRHHRLQEPLAQPLGRATVVIKSERHPFLNC